MLTNAYLFAAALIAGATLAAIPCVDARAAERPTGFLNREARIGDQVLPYVVYVPRDYTPDRKWPVILFLHGAGERGENTLPPSQVGIGSAIRLHPERFPCIAVMPQCPRGSGWGAATGFTPDSSHVAALALKALDECVAEYAGDVDRVYLTGLSMGGFGTWSIGSSQPTRFAALAPICGGGQPATMAKGLAGLPIWAFHGDADTVVPPQRSREMVDAVKAAGNERVRYTEFPGVAHNSWDKAYGDAEFIAWLFAQRRGQ